MAERKTAAKPAAKSARKAPAKKTTTPRKTGARKAPAKKSTAKKTTSSRAQSARKTPAKTTAKRQGSASKEDLKPEPPLDPTTLSIEQLKKLATELTPDGVIDPPQVAWEMRMRGYTWPQCARAAGYKNAEDARVGAQAYVKRAVIESGPERRGEALELADSRITALIGNWWERGRQDVAAARLVLDAIKEHMKLWRLTEPDAEQAVQRVIVVAGSEEEYVASLQRVVAERAAALPGGTPALPRPGPDETRLVSPE